MNDAESSLRSDPSARAQHALDLLSKTFNDAGWRVRRPALDALAPHPDLIVRRGPASYAIKVKAAPEDRIDRLVPLWSQACLQASHVAGANHAPLAVVAAPRVAPKAAEQVLKFASEYAPDAAVGIIDFGGLRVFRGPHLEGMDSYESQPLFDRRSIASDSANLFSDLNQWMLKVLLAPKIPDRLLAAPRGRYRNASQLARAANVSVMSAYRLLQLLEREGFLCAQKPYLNLVRREDFFRRWQYASALRSANEVPMRFLLRSNPRKELHRMLQSGRACLGLFAAADALGFGFVEGVPPHVYVRRLNQASIAAWKNIAPAEPGEVRDLILRQASAPESVFRALVRVNDVPAADVLQVWLDVASHPARGQEQADLIRRRVLEKVITGESASG